MRFKAKEIAQATGESQRAAMLLANLLFDVRGSTYPGDADEMGKAAWVEAAIVCFMDIESSVDEALDAMSIVLNDLGVRPLDEDAKA